MRLDCFTMAPQLTALDFPEARENPKREFSHVIESNECWPTWIKHTEGKACRSVSKGTFKEQGWFSVRALSKGRDSECWHEWWRSSRHSNKTYWGGMHEEGEGKVWPVYRLLYNYCWVTNSVLKSTPIHLMWFPVFLLLLTLNDV